MIVREVVAAREREVDEGGTCGFGKGQITLAQDLLRRTSRGQYAMMIWSDQSSLVPRFFLDHPPSPTIQDNPIGPRSKQSASPDLNIRASRSYAIDLPPFNKRRCIAVELDVRRAKIDTVKTLKTQTATELNACFLLSSKKHSGEIVTT